MAATWSGWSPRRAAPTAAESLLTEDPTPSKTYLPAGTPIHWVTGFQDDRAAQVTRLEWVDPPASDPLTRFEAVDVEVSLASPLGPWQEVGPWQLDRAADGSVTPFTFAAPTWARYVRVGGQVPPGDPTYWEMPSTFRVMERATDDSYRSVVGEWGMGQTTGIYEQLVPPDLALLSEVPDDDDTVATANPLAEGAIASGRVHRSDDVDWYSLTVPDGQNTVTFELGGTPFVRAGLTMIDDTGAAVEVDRSATYDPAVDSYTAIVTPGSTYAVQVEQLPSSVAITYDTSASLGDDLAFVAEALRSFAADVVPGDEAMQVTPFEQPSLLEDWSDVPYVIENAVDGGREQQRFQLHRDRHAPDGQAPLDPRRHPGDAGDVRRRDRVVHRRHGPVAEAGLDPSGGVHGPCRWSRRPGLGDTPDAGLGGSRRRHLPVRSVTRPDRPRLRPDGHAVAAAGPVHAVVQREPPGPATGQRPGDEPGRLHARHRW